MFFNDNAKLIEMRDRAAKLQVNERIFSIKQKIFLNLFQKEKERDERKQQGRQRKVQQEHEKVLNVVRVNLHKTTII